MLSVEENEALTRVGPGTPMGELLRRYWFPVAASSELVTTEPSGGLHRGGTKAVRLLGEDLVLFRDLKGRVGLIEPRCAHRRVNLVYGIPTEQGIRCAYHGWMYDVDGRCVEQPFEEMMHADGRFKSTVRLTAYRVEELGGLIFAYIGPEPAPLLPRWDLLVWDNVVRDIETIALDCNWVQAMENSVDQVHTQWLHANYTSWITGKKRTIRNHQKIAFDEFEHGIMKRRLYVDEPEDSADWTTGHPILFPNILRLGNQLQIRVPTDDEHTMHYLYTGHVAPPGVVAPTQDTIPIRKVPMYDEGGRQLLDFNQAQDTMAWVTQGPIAMRDKEKLGESDTGVIMYRRMLQKQAAIVADGGDPLNVFRDPAKNKIIELPTERPPGERRRRVAVGGDSGGGNVERRGSAEVQELLNRMYATAASTDRE